MMCIQVVERYAACRCTYHRHSIDPCAAFGTRGHGVSERTVFVGYKCPTHYGGRRSGGMTYRGGRTQLPARNRLGSPWTQIRFRQTHVCSDLYTELSSKGESTAIQSWVMSHGFHYHKYTTYTRSEPKMTTRNESIDTFHTKPSSTKLDLSTQAQIRPPHIPQGTTALFWTIDSLLPFVFSLHYHEMM